MGKELRCILCSTTYNTQRDMDEHMRSMLHHRELENLKGRDCDHECRVCQVTEVGLTGYANHISSSVHKQRMKERDQGKGADKCQEYFDAELIGLVEQRRKEMEQKAARQAEENRYLQWKEQGHSQHRSAHDMRFPHFTPEPKDHAMSSWQHPGLSHEAATGAHHDGYRPHRKDLRNWLNKKKRWPATLSADRPRDTHNWAPGVGHRGGKKLCCQTYSFQHTEQFSKPCKGNEPRKGRVQWQWDAVMEMDFTSDQLPASCIFGSNSVVESNQCVKQKQRTESVSQGNGVNNKDSKFGVNKSKVNHLSSWSQHEQDHQFHEMLQKAKKALQNTMGSVETLTINTHSLEPHQAGALTAKSSACVSANRKGMAPQESINNHRPKAERCSDVAMACEGSGQTTPHASFLKSADASTSTCKSLKVLPVSPKSFQEQKCVVEEMERDDEGLSCLVTPIQEVQELTEDMGHVLDGDVPKGAQVLPHVTALPNLSKLSLPGSLKRDLNRQVSKAHPNLNIARRIRNVTVSRKKDIGLKPTLQQLISSSGSWRSVKWDQVYQEVSKKKQEKGKGLPRFGIEMVTPVPSDPEVLSLEEEEEQLRSEGFHWESLEEPCMSISGTSMLKRSLSESNLEIGCKASISREVAAGKDASTSPLKKACKLDPDKPVTSYCDSPLTSVPTNAVARHHEQDQGGPSRMGNSETSAEEDLNIVSGDKQNDSQGAASTLEMDVPSPVIPVSKKTTKRKTKNKQNQVHELLTVSLREEELNGSLQALETNLLKARGDLQAAYMELQRLLMVKQEITTEMNTLRMKRIELLQGIQVSYEGGPNPLVTSEVPTTSTTVLSILPSSLVPQQNTFPSLLGQLSPAAVPSEVMPLTSILPTQSTSTTTVPLHIKQEPSSPLNPDLTESRLRGLPVGHHGSVAVSIDCSQDNIVELSALTRIPSSSGYESGNRSAQLKEPGTSPRDSADHSTHHSTVPKSLSLAKKKKYLKKKKKKAMKTNLGNDAEQQDSCSIPPLKTKVKMESLQVNTATPAATTLQEVEEVATPITLVPSELNDEGVDSDSSGSLAIVELVEGTPMEVVSVDSSDAEDKLGEEDSAPSTSVMLHAKKAKSERTACNEVSSTSELNTAVKDRKPNSETQPPLVSGTQETNPPGDSQDLKDKQEPSEGSFEGHQAAVYALQIHGDLLYTCSEDQSVRVFDIVSRECVGVLTGHTAKVNCLLVSSSPGLQYRLYTGSSDNTILCYSLKTRKCVQQFCLLDRVLCLHSCWKILFAGLANGSVVTFSLKANKQLDVFECHGPRAVSCLASTQEGARRILLVGSYDCTISVRDARSGLLLRTLQGHSKTVLCMKVVDDLVFSGSSDHSVHAHNIHTGELKWIYKGHTHSVTVVTVLGNVMITACLDKLVRVYELQSHDRLQVYGGHKDMVLCMAIHKSMIYTGCYDGCVQAVRLNLMHNYRCWWRSCSLIFGVKEHLYQHLAADHTSPSFQTLKCCWRDCKAFFTSRSSTKQDVYSHLKAHVEEDSASPEQ